MAFSSLNNFRILSWPLYVPNLSSASADPDRIQIPELETNGFPIRLMRYRVAAGALAAEAKRLGRPLRVVDLGCEKGWLKLFTPADAVEHWTGLDWFPRVEDLKKSGYDQVIDANFDLHLPLETASADAVVSLHVFEHLPRPGSTMSEVSRVLKPGGIFFGGAPTMPGFLASLREKWFRTQLKKGKIAEGGHINSLPPGRWRRLTYEVGMEAELVTGTHAIRLTGNPLENQEWWSRLNQFWGACFPSLGSDCYILARRGGAWTEVPVPINGKERRTRPLWIAGAIACVVLVGVAVWQWLKMF